MKLRIRLPRHSFRRVPRERGVRFERQGANGLLVFRLFAAILFAGFALMPPAALYAFSDGRLLSALLAVPLFTVFPWYPTLAAMAYTLGEATGSWAWLEIDGDRKEVRARRDGFLLLGHRTLAWSAGQLTSVTLDLRLDTPGGDPTVRLEIGHEGMDLPILGSERTRSFALRSDECQDREGLVTLAFDVARTLRWSGYRMERDDHLETSVRLLESDRDARTVPAVESGPPPAAASRQAASRVEPSWEAPDVDVAPFDPSSMEGSTYHVVAWTPGDRVAVRKPGLRGGQLVLASLLGTLLLNLPTLAAGAAIVSGAAGEVSLFWQLVVAGVFLFVTVLYNGFLFTEGKARREAVFAWDEGTLRVALDRRERTLSLESVQSLDVRGVEHRRGGSGGTSRSFACEVHVRTTGGEALVLATDTERRPDGPYRTAASFAEDLADALGVGWTWRGWRSRSLWNSVRRLIDRIAVALPA